jgi:TetR/AcrR family transcriptional regulator, cholesterol catabolism regulator
MTSARGARRGEILLAATRRFGREGYEHTKWADIARDVGVGPTALYHYFESKQHCLFIIMGEAVTGFRKRFDAILAEHSEPLRGMRAVFEDTFNLSESDVLRNRVLVAEQGLLSTPRRSPREEQARQVALARIRDVEIAWATLLARAMQERMLPEGDPRLLTRAVLGLYTGIWHWYRPEGPLTLDDLRDFFVDRAFAMIGAGQASDRRAHRATAKPAR